MRGNRLSTGRVGPVFVPSQVRGEPVARASTEPGSAWQPRDNSADDGSSSGRLRQLGRDRVWVTNSEHLLTVNAYWPPLREPLWIDWSCPALLAATDPAAVHLRADRVPCGMAPG
jgi:hypothetical protein